MQKGHQDQVRRDLVVGRAAQKRLAVLPPEGQERGQQRVGVQPTVRFEPGGLSAWQRRLRGGCQDARDDL
jgi:hypothetical protein